MGMLFSVVHTKLNYYNLGEHFDKVGFIIDDLLVQICSLLWNYFVQKSVPFFSFLFLSLSTQAPLVYVVAKSASSTRKISFEPNKVRDQIQSIPTSIYTKKRDKVPIPTTHSLWLNRILYLSFNVWFYGISWFQR